MARLSVYVKDELWKRAELVRDHLKLESPSQLVQLALEELVEDYSFEIKVKKKGVTHGSD